MASAILRWERLMTQEAMFAFVKGSWQAGQY